MPDCIVYDSSSEGVCSCTMGPHHGDYNAEHTNSTEIKTTPLIKKPMQFLIATTQSVVSVVGQFDPSDNARHPAQSVRTS